MRAVKMYEGKHMEGCIFKAAFLLPVASTLITLHLKRCMFTFENAEAILKGNTAGPGHLGAFPNEWRRRIKGAASVLLLDPQSAAFAH